MPELRSSMRATLSLLLFVAGFGLAIAALHQWAPASAPPLMAERLAEFDVDRESYDTLLFGSSRIFRGVDPVVLDGTTARHGQATRSFNLAFPGMRSHEMNAWMRHVLAHPPARLRYVLIEIDEWPTEIHDRLTIETSVRTGRYTARALRWHDASETLSVLYSIWISDETWAVKLSRARIHLAHWTARTVGLGDAARRLRGRLGSRDQTLTTTRVGRRGFTPYLPEDYHEGLSAFFRGQFLANLDAYHEAVAGLPETNRVSESLATYNVNALEEQIALVRAVGATPIYVLPPRGEATPRLIELDEQGYVTHLFDFGRPDRYPDLFELDHRFDAQHLSASGARFFSEYLGERFSDWLEGR